MKNILVLIMLFLYVGCLRNDSSIVKHSDKNNVYYFMFEKPLTNIQDSSRNSDKHEFINDDDTVTTNDEHRKFNCLDSSTIRKRKRYLDSIKDVINYYNTHTDETFYKRAYDNRITYSYVHRFLIDGDNAHVTYELSHNIGLDTTFIKSEAFLDSISVINNGTFLEDERKKSKLWAGMPIFLKEDTINIFVIERIADTDSLVFRKVNRTVIPWL